jgi:hypothetical protein
LIGNQYILDTPDGVSYTADNEKQVLINSITQAPATDPVDKNSGRKS